MIESFIVSAANIPRRKFSREFCKPGVASVRFCPKIMILESYFTPLKIINNRGPTLNWIEIFWKITLHYNQTCLSLTHKNPTSVPCSINCVRLVLKQFFLWGGEVATLGEEMPFMILWRCLCNIMNKMTLNRNQIQLLLNLSYLIHVAKCSVV